MGRWRKVRTGVSYKWEERIGSKADVLGVVQGNC